MNDSMSTYEDLPYSVTAPKQEELEEFINLDQKLKLRIEEAQEVSDRDISKHPEYECKFINISGNKMMVNTVPVGFQIYECHIACPKVFLPAYKALGIAALHWMFNRKDKDVKYVALKVPKGTMNNSMKKLGYTAAQYEQGMFLYFIPNPNLQKVISHDC